MYLCSQSHFSFWLQQIGALVLSIPFLKRLELQQFQPQVSQSLQNAHRRPFCTPVHNGLVIDRPTQQPNLSHERKTLSEGKDLAFCQCRQNCRQSVRHTMNSHRRRAGLAAEIFEVVERISFPFFAKQRQTQDPARRVSHDNERSNKRYTCTALTPLRSKSRCPSRLIETSKTEKAALSTSASIHFVKTDNKERQWPRTRKSAV